MFKKRRGGDSSFIGTLIAALCILIYLAALVQAAVRLYLSVDQYRNTAEQEFTRISNIALAAGMQGFMDDRFIDIINNTLTSGNSIAIEALIITGPEGEYSFEKQKGYAITWVNNSPRFINRISLSNQSYYKPLPIQNLRNVNIQAVARAYNNIEFTKILKETMFFVLIGFSLAFFTMLIQLLLGKPVKNTNIENNYTGNKSNNIKTNFKNNNFQDISRTGKPAGKTEPKKPGFYETPPVIHLESELEPETPKGLFSPRTNIGWEAYLNDRLNSELHRCASTEKDLTLMSIEFADSINETQIKLAAEETVSFFSSRDLLFEKGSKGITIIYPGFDLETSLAKAQTLYQKISDRILTNQNIYNSKSILIGLSSRSGRLIDAPRLLKEVNEALYKARIDYETSIIAFKSDPEKYRKFIASQSPRKT